VKQKLGKVIEEKKYGRETTSSRHQVIVLSFLLLVGEEAVVLTVDGMCF